MDWLAAESARPLLKGADLDHRQDEWVGSRPCTGDGLRSSVRRGPRASSLRAVMVQGITLGPVTVACSPSRW